MNPHDRIPARNQIMIDVGVTRVTVDRAISELIGEGYLYTKDGSGTYVAEPSNISGILNGRNNNASGNEIMSWGVLVPNIMFDTYPGIVRSIEDVAHENNINLIICNTDHEIPKQDEYIFKLIKSNVSGIIIVPGVTGVDCELSYKGFNELAASNIPVVFCNRSFDGVVASKVISNNFHGAFIATRHLIKVGYKKIAFIGSQVQYSNVEQRFQGYLSAFLQEGLEQDERYILMENYLFHKKEVGYRCMKKLLGLEEKPDAVFAYNDRIAAGVYQALEEAGLKVPDDIALVGYDDAEICDQLPIGLTTVRYPKYETGKEAAKLLLEMIHDPEMSPKTKILTPELVIRDSCGYRLKNSLNKEEKD